MNTDSGVIYRGPEIQKALERDEPVVPISPHVAEIVEAGHAIMNRAERRRLAREERRAARKVVR